MIGQKLQPSLKIMQNKSKPCISKWQFQNRKDEMKELECKTKIRKLFFGLSKKIKKHVSYFSTAITTNEENSHAAVRVGGRNPKKEHISIFFCKINSKKPTFLQI